MRLPFPHAGQANAKNVVFRLEVAIIGGPMTQEFLLKNPTPPTRTIEILGSQSLPKLHNAIFDAFDRYDEHMYEFQVGGSAPTDRRATRYSVKTGDDFIDDDAHDAAKTSVASLHLSPKDFFFYWFDFGDDWWHEITVLDIFPLEEKAKGFPRVIASSGESPEQYPDFDEDSDENFDEEMDIFGEDEEDESMEVDTEEMLQEPRYKAINAHLETFTKAHLNQDYLEVAQYILQDIFYSPLGLKRSKPESWAAGIMHAAGWVNLLGKPESSLHMPLKDIAKHFGVAVGTMEQKSRDIRFELMLEPLEPSYCIEENLEDNPLLDEQLLESLLEQVEALSDLEHAQREAVDYLSTEKDVKKGKKP